MAQFNKVILVGRFTRDLELRYIPSGTAVCDATIAVNDGFGDKEETAFIDLTLWGKNAENCCQYQGKGSEVLIEGRIKQDRWETDGQKRSKLLVTVDRVQFLDSKGTKEERGEPVAAAAPDEDIPF